MSPLLIPEPPLWHSLNRATGFWSKAGGSWTMTSPSMLISTWRMASLSKSPLASSAALNSQLSFAVVYSKSRDLFCLQFPQSHRGAFSVASNVIVCLIDFSLKAWINPKKISFLLNVCNNFKLSMSLGHNCKAAAVVRAVWRCLDGNAFKRINICGSDWVTWGDKNKAEHLRPSSELFCRLLDCGSVQSTSPVQFPKLICPLFYSLSLPVQLLFHCPVMGLLSSWSLAEASEGQAHTVSLVLHNKHPDACWTMSLLTKLHKHCPLCVCPGSIKSERGRMPDVLTRRCCRDTVRTI